MDGEIPVARCQENMGSRNGIAGLRLEGNGSAGIRLKDGSPIHFRFQPRQNRLHFYTPVAPLSSPLEAPWLASPGLVPTHP